MKNYKIYITVLLFAVLFSNCKNSAGEKVIDKEVVHTASEDEHGEEFILTQRQVDILNITVDKVSKRNMSGIINVNGDLGVPPQNEALVTTVLGANITSIKIMEGEEVKKGQVLANISHPNIITMQSEYLQSFNKLLFLEQDYKRQKKLYEAEVGSGRDFEKAKSQFISVKGLVNALEAQLKLIGLPTESLKEGKIAQTAPVRSPINGFIEKVYIKSGQFVQPQTAMFEIVNTEHIHVDLMVFEKDMSKVKNGQIVKFNIEAMGNKEMTAKIYAIGKSFEKEPKALHVHAEILNKDNDLIPGMYVRARIITDNSLEQALPESAIFQEGEHFYAFTAMKEDDGSWGFSPKEVIVRTTYNGYTSFDFIEEIGPNELVAQSGAFYLMAEMKKGETEHSH